MDELEFRRLMEQYPDMAEEIRKARLYQAQHGTVVGGPAQGNALAAAQDHFGGGGVQPGLLGSGMAANAAELARRRRMMEMELLNSM